MNKFTLPLETGTWKLTRDMFKQHARHVQLHRSYPLVLIKKITYANEILVIGISVNKESEERVYISVESDHLRVSCSAGTNEEALSREAYYTLDQMTMVLDYFDFEGYYWPGFFDARTGRSNYVDVIHDRAGLDIILKPKYTPFYKPAQALLFPLEHIPCTVFEEVSRPARSLKHEFIGYCLADTYLSSMHSNHWPFLIPSVFLATQNGKAVKNFSRLIDTDTDKDMPAQEIPQIQKELNAICYQMRQFAAIQAESEAMSEVENVRFREENHKNSARLFSLWQSVYPKLLSQRFTHHLCTYGMKNVGGRPKKKNMEVCIFSPNIPQLCFSWRDEGDYFQLKLLFKVKAKALNPAPQNTAFFLNAANKPLQFHLLNSFQDFHVVSLFRKYNFGISVLKIHYENNFKFFKDELARVYEFI